MAMPALRTSAAAANQTLRITNSFKRDAMYREISRNATRCTSSRRPIIRALLRSPRMRTVRAMAGEILNKIERLTAFLDRHRLDGVLLRQRNSFAWITGGKHNLI